MYSVSLFPSRGDTREVPLMLSAKRTETVFANLTWGWLACWGYCLIALAATGDFGKLKPYSSCSEDGKWDPDYSEPTANSQMLEAPTCRNQLLCFCRMLVCPSGLLKKSFLWGTNLLSHYIASFVDFSGLFQFLFSCLAMLAKLGINHFPHLRVIRTWIIIDIVFWFFKLPVTFSNLPVLKCLQTQIIWAKASQCKLLNITWEKVTGYVSFWADWG